MSMHFKLFFNLFIYLKKKEKRKQFIYLCICKNKIFI